MTEKDLQIAINKHRVSLALIQKELNEKIDKMMLEMENSILEMEKPIEEKWPTDSEFNQLLDFTENEINNIMVNKKKPSSNYMYSAVAKIISDVELSCGWYRCDSNWIVNIKGIQIKYGKLKPFVYLCQPINNTTHKKLNEILSSNLVAYVFEDTCNNNKRVCYLYPEQIILK